MAFTKLWPGNWLLTLQVLACCGPQAVQAVPVVVQAAQDVAFIVNGSSSHPDHKCRLHNTET